MTKDEVLKLAKKCGAQQVYPGTDVGYSMSLPQLLAFANAIARARQSWSPMETAPRDGQRILVYRPLAEKTHDDVIDIKRGIPRDSGCWEETVPDGMNQENYTDGYCKPTHWMPLPATPDALRANKE